MLRSHLAALAAATLAVTTLPAWAGNHHICYEGQPRLSTVGGVVSLYQSAVFGCSEDSGGSCSITQVNSATPRLENWPYPNRSFISAPGTFAVFESGPGGAPDLTAEIKFSDGSTTTCSVQPQSRESGGRISYDGSSKSMFVGFMTDDSGYLSSGIWRSTSTLAKVPANLMLTAGGVEAAPGSFIQRSNWSGMQAASPGAESWNTSTVDDRGQPTKPVASYAIGLRVQGLETAKLASWVERDGAQAGYAFVPAVASARRAWPDSVAFGGDFSTSQLSHTASTTAPVVALQWLNCVLMLQFCPPATAVGWRAEATGPGPASSALLYISARYLPRLITLDDGSRWELRSAVVSAATQPGQAQQVQAGGLRGRHALAAVGGTVDWKPFASVNPPTWGNRLTALVPDAAIGGARVTSNFGATTDPARLTAWAVGLHLVPEGAPPELQEPWKSDRPFDVSVLCDSLPEMDFKTRLCESRGKLLAVGRICPEFGDELQPFGLCVPGKP